MAFFNKKIVSENSYTEEDDTNPEIVRHTFLSRGKWVVDAGLYKSWVYSAGVLKFSGGSLSIANHGFVLSDGIQKKIYIERFNGTNWVRGTPTGYTRNVISSNDTSISVEWTAIHPAGSFVVRLDLVDSLTKWTYTFTASIAGRYRMVMELLPLLPVDEYYTYKSKSIPNIVQADWYISGKKYTYNWADLYVDNLVDVQDVSSNGVVITSKGKDFIVGESFVIDPTFGPQSASWGADCDGSSKYPNDGGDWVGYNGSVSFRTANKFDITSLPATATVTQVDYSCYVNTAGGGTDAWTIGAYNGDGQANSETDIATTYHTRCDVSADYYVTGSTSFRTTGSKSFTALGSAANTDVENARDAGTIFSIAMRQDNETSSAYADIDEYTGTNPAALTVTYTTAGTQINATSVSHTVTTYNPTVSHDIGITALSETQTQTTYNPIISYNVGITPNSQAHTAVSNNPVVSYNVDIEATSQAHTITTYNPSIDFGTGTQINATSVSHTVTTYNPSISYDVGISPGFDSRTITANNPAVSYNTNFTPNSKALTQTAYNVIIGYNVDVTATNAALTSTTYNPVVQYGAIIPPDSEGLEYTLSSNRCHYSFDENLTNYTIDINRLHYDFSDED